MPVTAKIQRYTALGAEIGTTSLNNVSLPTNRASALNTKVTTVFSQFMALGAGQLVKLVLTDSDSTLSMVAAGSSLLLERVE